MAYIGCKILFAQEQYGRHSNAQLLQDVGREYANLMELREVVTIKGKLEGCRTYGEVMEEGASQSLDSALEKVEAVVHSHDACNLQYTSGSTGQPKAATLTHQ